MAYTRCGFIPSRQVAPGWVRNYPVNALAKEVAINDAVTMLTGQVLAASGATNPTKQLLGICLAVYTTAGRPLTFLATKYIASGGVGRADICIDPYQPYIVQCVASVGGSNIGGNVMIDVSAANATTGISGMSVDIPTSASTNELFKIINIASTELIPYQQGTLGGAANNGVEVVPNFHFMRSATAAI